MSIKNRMRQVIATGTPDRSRYIDLMEKTGISANIWKNFWFDRKEPDAHMVERLCQAWPEYALWVTTGVSDVAHGHKAPEGTTSKDGEPDFTARVRETARAIWGEDCKQMADASGIDQQTWSDLMEGRTEPTLEMVRAVGKHGAKYALWMLNGRAETYMQISPQDGWKDKLARVLGADLEDDKDQWQKKFVKALGVRTDSQK